jgi:hypothetical protein
MTEAGISRIKRAADRAERRAWRAVNTTLRFRNPIGRGAIRSGRVAARYFDRARQLILALEMRLAASASEKRKRLSAATSEFNKTWNRGKRKGKAA